MKNFFQFYIKTNANFFVFGSIDNLPTGIASPPNFTAL